jgi:hypothetical protein
MVFSDFLDASVSFVRAALRELTLELRPIPPKGGWPRQARGLACAPARVRRDAAHQNARRLPSARLVRPHTLMLAPKAFGLEPRFAGYHLVPRRGSSAKSTVCGLNGFLPSAKADGALHLNPRPPLSRGSCAFASLRRGQTATHVSVLERKIAPRSLFLSKTESKDSGREGERRGAMAQPKRSRPLQNNKMFHIEQSINTDTRASYYEHQSHHHQR